MNKINLNNQSKINAGKTVSCACGREFSDVKFLWWTVFKAENLLSAHQKKYCPYRAGYVEL